MRAISVKVSWLMRHRAVKAEMKEIEHENRGNVVVPEKSWLAPGVSDAVSEMRGVRA